MSWLFALVWVVGFALPMTLLVKHHYHKVQLHRHYQAHPKKWRRANRRRSYH